MGMQAPDVGADQSVVDDHIFAPSWRKLKLRCRVMKPATMYSCLLDLSVQGVV